MQTDDPRFILGIELFNQREFFECHEILEELWKVQEEPDRQLTQGIIQIAVAYHHALRANHRGAVKLIRKGLPRIKSFASEFRNSTLNWDQFISAVELDLTTLDLGKSSELLIPLLKN